MSLQVSLNPENVFSHKRYFVNNVNEYHGENYVKEISKIFANEAPPAINTSQSIIGEGDAPPPPTPVEPYEIIGTVSDVKITKVKNVTRIIPKNACLPQMLTCGYVIMDISADRNEVKIAMDFAQLLKELFEKEPITDENDVTISRRHLILISTVMTWAMTKPLDPETPEMAFIEADFRKRKPHANYKAHFDVENEVIKLSRKYKSNVSAIVVAAGVTYGGREDVLFYWFQKAWECEPLLPILGRGTNVIPLINIIDLSSIVYNLVIDFPKKHYILAVEQSITKQREIVKPLGKIVGSGMFKCIPLEDAFLIPEITQRDYDLMTLNLYMEPTFIVESMGLQWVSELTFAENVPALIKQFKKERKLKPFKILIYGPPIIGKTTVSKQICEVYGLIYVSAETIVADIINETTSRLAHFETGELTALGLPTGEEGDDGQDDDDAGEEEGFQENLRQTLATLQSGRPLSDEETIGYIRQRLLNHEALNRGWVLDGYPTSVVQCPALFGRGEEEEEPNDVDEEYVEDEFEEDITLYDHVLKRLLPDVVVSLEASDDFICEKAMRQPEGDPRLEEEVVLRQLTEFRAGDTREMTPLNFFDEIDIHPLVVPISDHSDYDMQKPYAAITLRMGAPCRYGKLLAIIEAAEKKEKEIRETLKSKEDKIKRELEEKMKQEREDKMEYWTELYALLREEEEAALAAAGEPMRNYLINHIFPTLTPALLEVAKVRPQDPIDYLAEYLFKLNPSGKMLEPGYNLQGELFLGKLKLLDDTLRELDIIIDPLIPPEAEVGGPPKKK